MCILCYGIILLCNGNNLITLLYLLSKRMLHWQMDKPGNVTTEYRISHNALVISLLVLGCKCKLTTNLKLFK
jgi:hypothetical protein